MSRFTSSRHQRRAWAAPTALSAAAVVCAALAAGCSAASGSAASADSAGSAASAPVSGQAETRVATTDWSAYLDGPRHASDNQAQTAITPAKAAGLVQQWHADAGTKYLASPTVADGSVFIGSDTGWFYQLSASTGRVRHKAFLGYDTTPGCYADLGVVATATVAADPVTHRDTVYVGGADGYLYAFSAANLKLEWKSLIARPSKTVPNYYQWSSPTVAAGKIYVGVASNCERPLVRGGVIAYNQATGKKLAEFYSVPAGKVGGGVWSSVAVGPGGYVYATTGNGPLTDGGSGPQTQARLGHSESIVKLDPGTLRVAGAWQIPGPAVSYDTDFGGSPVIFGGDVGACNKDGIFYAVHQSSMRLAWKERVGAVYAQSVDAECNAAPAYDGRHLYLAGTAVALHGTHYRGSIQERQASNGKLIWETGLPEGVTGSPSMDGGRVIAVGTYDNGTAPTETYLVNAATGKVIRALVQGMDFAQSTFADGMLFTANSTGVYAWAPG
jgi:outer membrane protein assembly factor BamB